MADSKVYCHQIRLSMCKIIVFLANKHLEKVSTWNFFKLMVTFCNAQPILVLILETRQFGHPKLLFVIAA